MIGKWMKPNYNGGYNLHHITSMEMKKEAKAV